MKKIKLIYAALLLSGALVFTSCSNQMYGYRQKVKADRQELAQAKPAKPSELATIKPSEVPSKPLLAAEMPEVTLPKANVQPTPKAMKKANKISERIAANVVAQGSKAAIKGLKKKVSETENLVKELSKPQFGGIDGKRWMIIGLVIMLVAVVLGLVLDIPLLYGIGVIIFLVGLIFFLIDYLA